MSKNQVNFFNIAILIVDRYLGHQDSRMWNVVSDVLKTLVWFKNSNITNKIPFLDVYGDINLVDHVIKSYKARRALWKI